MSLPKKVALSQGRYTWLHNRVLQELAVAICDAKGLLVQPKTRALVLPSEGGTKSWCGSAAGMESQRKSLLDDCGDLEFSADVSEWNKYPKVVQYTRMRPDIVFHSSATRQSSWSNSQYHTRVEWKSKMHIKEKHTRT
ncbi:reverse transcriptase [Plakobranchus ocellatus]|uniref:Reverse transcriptase n=1 Tax=Plakobranchus ocellatus TaxID=259542 RepID=A0AAV4B6V9_9GAST|nr:reverse transcriptase [Plakobranchus ocellatus]